MSGAADGPGTPARPDGCTAPASNGSSGSVCRERRCSSIPASRKHGPASASSSDTAPARYDIAVENPDGVSRGIVRAELDGVALPGQRSADPSGGRRRDPSRTGRPRMMHLRRRNIMPENVSPLAGKPVEPSMLVNVPRLVTAYFTGKPDPAVAGAARCVRHVGPSRLGLRQRLQRGAHPGDQSGDLPSPEPQRHHRPAVHRHRHACAVRARLGQRARSVCRQRGRRDDRRARRLHADARHFACHPDLQPEPQERPRRRDRHHPVAQSARGWRLQIQPAERRPGRYRRDELDRAHRERAARTKPRRRAAHPLRPRAQIAPCPSPRLYRPLCRRPRERRRHGGDPRVRGERSGSIRWAAPASIIGNRSSNAMASRRRSSTTRSIRPFAS